MKKLMVLCMVIFLCVGCSSNTNTERPQSESTNNTGIMYSNLVDITTQKEVTALLESHGVTKEQTDTLISWVNDFNSRVTSSKLPEGFNVMESNGGNYSNVFVEYKELDEETLAPEANCRLTSYLLMKNRIQTNGKQEDNDTFLMFDIEAIDTYEPFHLSEEERTNFISLFNWVPVSGTSTLQEHINKIEEAWKDREITINNEDGISLITIYLHSTFEEVRFVGHTGVLLETKDGLLFVEKYGPNTPFQATKFQTREELKDYLLSRVDLYGEETELDPIIMENDRVLIFS